MAIMKSLQYSLHPAMVIDSCRKRFVMNSLCSSDNVLPESSHSIWKKAKKSQILFCFF